MESSASLSGTPVQLSNEMLMLIKDINIKSLASGDKSGRITLEVAYPEDIAVLKDMLELLEVDVDFKLTITNKRNNIKQAE